jgi:hypothetical protein
MQFSQSPSMPKSRQALGAGGSTGNASVKYLVRVRAGADLLPIDSAMATRPVWSVIEDVAARSSTPVRPRFLQLTVMSPDGHTQSAPLSEARPFQDAAADALASLPSAAGSHIPGRGADDPVILSLSQKGTHVFATALPQLRLHALALQVSAPGGCFER